MTMIYRPPHHTTELWVGGFEAANDFTSLKKHQISARLQCGVGANLGAAQHSTSQYSTAQHSAVQCCTVAWCTVVRIAVVYSAVLHCAMVSSIVLRVTARGCADALKYTRASQRCMCVVVL